MNRYTTPMINSNKLVLVSLFVLLFSSVWGQPTNWHSIDIQDANAYNISGLIYSSNLGMTVCACTFVPDSGNKFIAGYDGFEWISLSDSVGGGFRTVVDYEDGILIGGGTPYIGSQNMPHIAYYNGITWSYPWNFNDGITRLQWVNDTLFATGVFTEIDGQPANGVARLVDGHWEGMYQPTEDLEFAIFGPMAYYHNHYYIGGNFESVIGPDDLAMLENGELHYVGEGLTGDFTGVTNLETYQDKLYIAGQIPISQGNIANHILRWDGQILSGFSDTLYHDPGQLSTYGSVGTLKKRSGDLFMSGDFRYIWRNSYV